MGAYTVATGVGALRMLNRRHWQSDVLAGAGIGLLSTHLAYALPRHRRAAGPAGASLSLRPTWAGNGHVGAALVWRL